MQRNGQRGPTPGGEHRRQSVRAWPNAAAALVLVCGGLIACGSPPPAQAPGRVSPASLLGAQQGYLVVYRPADQWSNGAALPEQPIREHARYLLSLYRAGSLKFAGAFGGNGGGGGMLFTAADDDAALRIIEADPAVIADVFDFTLRPWKLADWDERDRTWPK